MLFRKNKNKNINKNSILLDNIDKLNQKIK